MNHVWHTNAWSSSGPPSPIGWFDVGVGYLPVAATPPVLAWTGYPGDLVAAVAQAGTTVYATYDATTWSLTSSQPASAGVVRTIEWPGGNQLFLGGVRAFQTPDYYYGSAWNSFVLPSLYEHPDVRAFYWHNFGGGNSYLWDVNDGRTSSGVYANITRWNWSVGSAPASGVAIPHDGATWQVYFAAQTGPTSTSYQTRTFAGSQDNGGVCSDNFGVSWQDAGFPSASCIDHVSMAIAPSNGDYGYFHSCDPLVYRSTNLRSASSCASVNWSSGVSVNQPWFWTPTMIAVHPSVPTRAYFARSDARVVATDDGGATLTDSAGFAMPSGAQPISLTVDSGGYIFVGTLDDGVYRSTTPGVTGLSFAAFGLNSPGAPRAVMRISTSCGGANVFAATTSGLYRRIGGGAWALVAGGGGYAVSDVEIDPGCPSHIFASYGYKGILGQHRGGVIESTTNGASGSWTSISAGYDVHQTGVPDIQVDISNRRYLWAATYGRGVWLYDQQTTPATCGCP